MFPKNAFVIVGPTASGKSDAAVSLALKNNGEIISADSVQVYRRLDIGSGKITSEEMKGAPHHLLSIADPGQKFTVEDFRELGNQALVQIFNSNCIPIIAGGTGFYIDTLVNNIRYPSIDIAIKSKLQNLGVEHLNKLAIQTLPEYIWQSFDNKNPTRLRNRIGLWQTHQEIPKPEIIKRDFEINFIWLGLNPSKEILLDRITRRTDSRINNGMIDEVSNLIETGIEPKWLKTVGLEYRLITEHLENKTTLEDLRTQIIQADLKYAKRQLTWFKRNKDIKWFEDPEELVKSVNLPTTTASASKPTTT